MDPVREAIAGGAPGRTDTCSSPTDPRARSWTGSSTTTRRWCAWPRAARTAVGKVVLGSVSAAVVRASPVPVLLVGPAVRQVGERSNGWSPASTARSWPNGRCRSPPISPTGSRPSWSSSAWSPRAVSHRATSPRSPTSATLPSGSPARPPVRRRAGSPAGPGDHPLRRRPRRQPRCRRHPRSRRPTQRRDGQRCAWNHAPGRLPDPRRAAAPATGSPDL